MRYVARSLASLLVAGLMLANTANAQELTVPELTGRVVDQADMLEAPAEAQLTSMLASHEQASGEQVVVVTVPDLQGRSIEEFGLELGRTWGIGEADTDSGALLIIARDDRRIRIEVGYGLEGRLTDAQSSAIINSIITPAFRQNEFERGIVEGATAMVQVLGGDPLRVPEAQPQPVGAGDKPPVGIFILLFFIVMGLIGGGGRGGRGKRGRLGTAMLAGALLGGMGGGRGGMGGGGFGGGGGGFGGGGASGGW